MAPTMPFVVLGLRVVLGAVLIVAGALKVGHAPALAAALAGFHLVPAAVIPTIALILPWIELLLGGYLVAGLFTRVAGWAGFALFAIYAFAIGSAVVRGLPADCGCFGPSDTATADWPHVAMDSICALAGLIVALRGPGALSVDMRFLRR